MQPDQRACKRLWASAWLALALSAACRSAPALRQEANGRAIYYDTGVLAAWSGSTSDTSAGPWRVYYSNGRPMIFATLTETGRLSGPALFWNRDGVVSHDDMELDLKCIDTAITMRFRAPWHDSSDLDQLPQADRHRVNVALSWMMFAWKGSGIQEADGSVAAADSDRVAEVAREMLAFAAARSHAAGAASLQH